MRRTRGVVLALVAASLAILGLLDRDVTVDGGRQFGRSAVAAMPVADGPDVLATTWFCAAGTASAGGSANLSVVIANTSGAAASGMVTWYPAGAEPVATPVDVAASGSVTLAAVDAVDASVVSAVVDVRGGGIAVEHVVSGPRGASVAPCASDASPTWYFANGTTERDAVEVLALFNPFPDDTIVDITFATDEGRDEPSALSGLPVPAGTTTLVNVHDYVRRRAVAAAAVVARRGRLVVDRVQSFNGVLGRRGVSLTLGAPALSEEWTFPEGFWTDGLSQQWHVFNPNDREALVSLEIVPTDGAAVEPIDLTVPARSQLVIDAAGSERVPKGIGHSSSIESLNGVPVVAERTLDARSPSPRRGWTSSLGSPLARRSWVLPLGEVSGNTDEWVVVHNPGLQPRTVSIAALAGGQRLAIEGLQDLEIGPGDRIGLRIGDHIRRSPLPLLVESDGDVVVERDLYRVGATGITSVMGIPF